MRRAALSSMTRLWSRLSKRARFGGAAIDTWEKEPLDPNDPLVKMEKVITTSHLGAATRETVVRCFGVGYDNICGMRRGEEPQPHRLIRQ